VKHLSGIMLLVLSLAMTPTAPGGPAPDWRTAAPGYQWSFPRDLYAHPDYKTEWWYLTGHLETEHGDDLAFQLTFFRIGILPPTPSTTDSTVSAWHTADLIMAHAAVTDPTNSRHVFSEVIWRTTPFLGGFGTPGDTTLAWCRAPAGTAGRWQLTNRDGSYHIRAHDRRQGLQFDLRCEPDGPPVLHGNGGFSPKCARGNAGSLYFSQPMLQVSGTMLRDGNRISVTGQGWLDREIFTSTLGAGQRGWDWLALQLQDGRQIMLYRLLDRQGEQDFALGTLVLPDGSSHPLPADSWRLLPDKQWTSPHTAARYPVSWRLTIPDADLDLDLKAVLPDQENVSRRTGIHYWEGAVTVTERGGGRPAGRGFVELTGYGPNSRPPI